MFLFRVAVSKAVSQHYVHSMDFMKCLPGFSKSKVLKSARMVYLVQVFACWTFHLSQYATVNIRNGTGHEVLIMYISPDGLS